MHLRAQHVARQLNLKSRGLLQPFCRYKYTNLNRRSLHQRSPKKASKFLLVIAALGASASLSTYYFYDYQAAKDKVLSQLKQFNKRVNTDTSHDIKNLFLNSLKTLPFVQKAADNASPPTGENFQSEPVASTPNATEKRQAESTETRFPEDCCRRKPRQDQEPSPAETDKHSLAPQVDEALNEKTKVTFLEASSFSEKPTEDLLTATTPNLTVSDQSTVTVAEICKSAEDVASNEKQQQDAIQYLIKKHEDLDKLRCELHKLEIAELKQAWQAKCDTMIEEALKNAEVKFQNILEDRLEEQRINFHKSTNMAIETVKYLENAFNELEEDFEKAIASAKQASRWRKKIGLFLDFEDHLRRKHPIATDIATLKKSDDPLALKILNSIPPRLSERYGCQNYNLNLNDLQTEFREVFMTYLKDTFVNFSGKTLPKVEGFLRYSTYSLMPPTWLKLKLSTMKLSEPDQIHVARLHHAQNFVDQGDLEQCLEVVSELDKKDQERFQRQIATQVQALAKI